MLIPKTENKVVDIYYCSKCEKYYISQTGRVQMRCLVNHPPDTCCHFSEKEVSKKTFKEIHKLLAR